MENQKKFYLTLLKDKTKKGNWVAGVYLEIEEIHLHSYPSRRLAWESAVFYISQILFEPENLQAEVTAKVQLLKKENLENKKENLENQD